MLTDSSNIMGCHGGRQCYSYCFWCRTPRVACGVPCGTRYVASTCNVYRFHLEPTYNTPCPHIRDCDRWCFGHKNVTIIEHFLIAINIGISTKFHVGTLAVPVATNWWDRYNNASTKEYSTILSAENSNNVMTEVATSSWLMLMLWWCMRLRF